jgi:hypothetical protein
MFLATTINFGIALVAYRSSSPVGDGLPAPDELSRAVEDEKPPSDAAIPLRWIGIAVLFLLLAGALDWAVAGVDPFGAILGFLYRRSLPLAAALFFALAAILSLRVRGASRGATLVVFLLAAFASGFAPIAVIAGLAWWLPHAALFTLNNVALNRDRLALQPSDLGRLPLHFLDNGFWGLPSTFLLGVLAARHVAAVAARFAAGWRAGIAALSPLETLAIGWTVGIAAPTALLVRAVDERRIVIVLVPLAVLAAIGLASPRTRPAAAPASRGARVVLAAAVTIVALALAFAGGYGATFWSWGLLAALAGAVLLAIGLAGLAARGMLSGSAAVGATLTVAGVLPALNLGRFADWATPVPGWIATLAGLAALAAVVAERERRAARVVLAAYLAWGAIAIGAPLVRPTYTLRDASAAIGALAAPGDAIVGAFAHELALANRTHPIWHTPRRAYNRLLNPDLARFPVRWVLTAPESQMLRADEYPFPTTPVRELPLLPAPRGGFKVHATLHQRAR